MEKKQMIRTAVRGCVLTGASVAFPLILLIAVFGAYKAQPDNSLPWILTAAIGAVAEVCLIVLSVVTMKRFRRAVAENGQPEISKQAQYAISQWTTISGLADTIGLGISYIIIATLLHGHDDDPVRVGITVSYFVLLVLVLGAFITLSKLKPTLNCEPAWATNAKDSKPIRKVIAYTVVMVVTLVAVLAFSIADHFTGRFYILKFILWGVLYMEFGFSYISELLIAKKGKKPQDGDEHHEEN
ncbi:MAG TPA: hypothetical protein DDW30_07620 [Clostridiales bacterium]|nr:hypothetical protein [Clostridiales bacterium]